MLVNISYMEHMGKAKNHQKPSNTYAESCGESCCIMSQSWASKYICKYTNSRTIFLTDFQTVLGRPLLTRKRECFFDEQAERCSQKVLSSCLYISFFKYQILGHQDLGNIVVDFFHLWFCCFRFHQFLCFFQLWGHVFVVFPSVLWSFHMLGLKDISTFSAFGFEFSKVFLVFGFSVFGFGYHSCLHSLNIEGAGTAMQEKEQLCGRISADAHQVLLSHSFYYFIDPTSCT